VQKEARDIKIYAIAKEISKSPTFFSMTAQQKKDAFVEQLNKLGIEKFKTRKV
jgi:hypothetical protein